MLIPELFKYFYMGRMIIDLHAVQVRHMLYYVIYRTVTYKNDYGNAMSTCTWSGQRQLSSNDMPAPVILTTWLLTSQTDAKDNWKSTLTNQDTFWRPKEVTGDPCGPETT